MKKKNILIIIAVIAFVFIYHLGWQNISIHKEKPSFFERFPDSVKKVRQHININIDYEKLPARNEIRLIGRVDTKLKAKVIEYKWTLTENLKHKKGAISGMLNLKDSNEIILDVAIKDMNKKINVRLEAYVQGQKVKIGSVQSFTYDPMNEDQMEADRMEAQSKSESEILTKEELLKTELAAPRKPSLQQ